jgi:hypothetical protein
MEMAMTKHPDNDLLDASTRLSRRARLHTLLFAGTVLGTTLLTVLAEPSGKLPPFRGE